MLTPLLVLVIWTMSSNGMSKSIDIRISGESQKLFTASMGIHNFNHYVTEHNYKALQSLHSYIKKQPKNEQQGFLISINFMQAKMALMNDLTPVKQMKQKQYAALAGIYIVSLMAYGILHYKDHMTWNSQTFIDDFFILWAMSLPFLVLKCLKTPVEKTQDVLLQLEKIKSHTATIPQENKIEH